MPRFMLYAHSNTASDNMVRCERKVHQKEDLKKVWVHQFIFWISREKVYCFIKLALTLDLRVFFPCFSTPFWLQNNWKPQNPSDNLDLASRYLFQDFVPYKIRKGYFHTSMIQAEIAWFLFEMWKRYTSICMQFIVLYKYIYMYNCFIVRETQDLKIQL